MALQSFETMSCKTKVKDSLVGGRLSGEAQRGLKNVPQCEKSVIEILGRRLRSAGRAGRRTRAITLLEGFVALEASNRSPLLQITPLRPAHAKDGVEGNPRPINGVGREG